MFLVRGAFLKSVDLLPKRFAKRIYGIRANFANCVLYWNSRPRLAKILNHFAFLPLAARWHVER